MAEPVELCDGIRTAVGRFEKTIKRAATRDSGSHRILVKEFCDGISGEIFGDILEALRGLPDGELNQRMISRWLQLLTSLEATYKLVGCNKAAELTTLQPPLIKAFCDGSKAILAKVSENIVSTTSAEASGDQKQSKSGQILNHAPRDFFSVLDRNLASVIPHVNGVAVVELASMHLDIIREFVELYCDWLEGHLVVDGSEEAAASNVDLDTSGGDRGKHIWITPLGLARESEEPVLLIQGQPTGEDAICGVVGSCQKLVALGKETFDRFNTRVSSMPPDTRRHVVQHIESTWKEVRRIFEHLCKKAAEALANYTSATIALDSFAGLFSSSWDRGNNSEDSPRNLISQYMIDCVTDHQVWIGWKPGVHIASLKLFSALFKRYCLRLAVSARSRRMTPTRMHQGVYNDVLWIKRSLEKNAQFRQALPLHMFPQAFKPFNALLKLLKAKAARVFAEDVTAIQTLQESLGESTKQVISHLRADWRSEKSSIEQIHHHIDVTASRSNNDTIRSSRDSSVQNTFGAHHAAVWKSFRKICLSGNVESACVTTNRDVPALVFAVPTTFGFRVLSLEFDGNDVRMKNRGTVALRKALRQKVASIVQSYEKEESKREQETNSDGTLDISTKKEEKKASKDGDVEVITLEDLLGDETTDPVPGDETPDPAVQDDPESPVESKTEEKTAQVPVASEPKTVEQLKEHITKANEGILNRIKPHRIEKEGRNPFGNFSNRQKMKHNAGAGNPFSKQVKGAGNPFGSPTRKPKPSNPFGNPSKPGQSVKPTGKNPFGKPVNANPFGKPKAGGKLFGNRPRRTVRKRRPLKQSKFSPAKFFAQHPAILEKKRKNPFADPLGSRSVSQRSPRNPFSSAMKPSISPSNPFSKKSPNPSNPFSANSNNPGKASQISKGNPFSPGKRNKDKKDVDYGKLIATEHRVANLKVYKVGDIDGSKNSIPKIHASSSDVADSNDGCI
eukprot:CAMPEP_0114488576 /NCGR_PEP_ID=MMETSP0109-20121206/1409_1 /TAXON_ID=29199 /ORGANISM="Chlorarachnion reptans, Strain CCCM449" /LENGTH=961 /DNA_ID=CAMNT_0001664989 /DNA_START=516 /DNA_END=3398 /DNA_ORIENTATION=-